MNDKITPRQNNNECVLILFLDSPPIDTKLKTFKEIMGNTHGIRFKIKPPRNAKRIAEKTESEADDCSVSDKEASITNDSLFIERIP